jgi:hypothetical protein
MPISFNNKLAFVHIPKCAGTTITKIIGGMDVEHLYSPNKKLFELPNLKLNYDNKLKEEELKNALRKSPQHLTAYELTQFINDLPLMFTVVRNPFDRLVSEYFFVRSFEYKKDIRFVKTATGFSDFIKWGLTLPKALRISIFDGHLETQTSFIYNNGVCLVPNIFKFEKLEDCFLFLTNKMEYSCENASYSRNTVHDLYQTYYDDALVKIVENFYKDDLINFQYTFL